ncbi:MAG TPA: tryptophan-rich sensory protein [Gemmatimonadales bacterium]|nr:tryptophan-rich sensory protein [Gemmatimonadales bacterium]
MGSATFALLICAGAAALEGALAGRGIRARFAELRLPRFSPPFFVWIFIGGVYYAICFVILYRLVASNRPTPTHNVAFVLVVVLMAANAAWGLLFFRRKDLRASFLAFLPYGFLTLLLIVTLASIDWISALVLAPYVAYLGYALWWAHRVWLLNRA